MSVRPSLKDKERERRKVQIIKHFYISLEYFPERVGSKKWLLIIKIYSEFYANLYYKTNR